MTKKVWALIDDRQGNTGQVLGIANATGLEYEVKKVLFNPFIRLPNPLLNNNTLGIRHSSRALLTPPWPDLVIASARRCGIAASYIKSQHPSTFLVQVQWPGWPNSQFDLIAPPIHDNISARANILTTLGAPHMVTDDFLQNEAALWQKSLDYLPKPRIAVLIGGGKNAVSFGTEHGPRLAGIASAMASSLGGSLLVTTSRRTGSTMANTLANELQCQHLLHVWHDNQPNSANPYYGFLGLADAVIVTGDSVSMCSEACATGKPVYIYDPVDLVSKKHRRFLDSLYRHGLAKPLERLNNTLFIPPYRLNDALAVADEIRKRAPSLFK